LVRPRSGGVAFDGTPRGKRKPARSSYARAAIPTWNTIGTAGFPFCNNRLNETCIVRIVPFCLDAKEYASVLLKLCSDREGMMPAAIAPTARRRTVLQLLAGTIAGAGLKGLGAGLAFAAEPLARVGDTIVGLESDAVLHSRVVARQGGGFEPLTDFEPSETLRLADGKRIDRFPLLDQRSEAVNDVHGHGTRHVLRGRAGEGIEKEISVVLYDRFPGFALQRVSYRNVGPAAVRIEGWVNGAHVLKPMAGGALDYWSFSGASYEDRRDWVQRVRGGFGQRNFMGMNASDYGGGTPVVDVWRRDYGLAVGHVETVPKLLALPLTTTAAGARIAVECDRAVALAPGEGFSTFDTFVAVHRGDYFAVLDAYRRILAERGVAQAKVPAAAYEPIWCAWGYERGFTVDQVVATLPKASELGLGWAVLDDGWQTAVGDWYLDRRKFPRGDADMIALVAAIKDAGLKPKLWIAPLAADPRSELVRHHADLMLLDRDGKTQDVSWWDSFCLCPAYPPTVERSKALVRKIMGEWGYAGLKLDGQHLNGVAPCYNPAHEHTRPEESVEKLQDFWKAIYTEAISINPDAVIEICPCGTAQAFHNMPYMNQPVASDPESSWQVRHKGKTIKALMGPSTAYAGDHVELSDNGDDFASTIGIGAIVSTKFTWPRGPNAENKFLLTTGREAEWRRWIALYNEKRLPEGRYRGELYDIGFDQPEAHVIEKDGRYHYAFYADHWDGPVELRGLGKGRYTVADTWTGRTIGSASATANRLSVWFERFLLLEATPLDGT
jgi:alpha-galactosidase